VLAERIDRPLAQLGAEAATWVMLEGNDRRVFCHQET
jgi:hypothetical protein